MSGSRRHRAATLAKSRDKRREARAKETQAAQRHAAKKHEVSLRAYRLRRTIGWSLVVLAVLLGVSHWLEHLQVFSIASPGVQDLFFGYPMAGFLGIAGAIVLSR